MCLVLNLRIQCLPVSKETMMIPSSLLRFLILITHFVKERRLHSISNGIAVESTANSYNAKAVGNTVLQKMQIHALSEFKFIKADQIKTSASISVIRCGDDKLEVNPLLLFDRLVKVSTDLRSDIKYELTPQPSALFDGVG